VAERGGVEMQQRCRDVEVQVERCRSAEVQKCRDAQVQRCRDVQRCVEWCREDMQRR